MNQMDWVNFVNQVNHEFQILPLLGMKLCIGITWKRMIYLASGETSKFCESDEFGEFGEFGKSWVSLG